MISFVEGNVPVKNATVTVGDLDHEAFAVRDAEGNVEVTLDAELNHGDPVKLVNHKEKDATYEGSVEVRDGQAVFVK